MVSSSDKVTITRGEFDALVRRESELAAVTADRARLEGDNKMYREMYLTAATAYARCVESGRPPEPLVRVAPGVLMGPVSSVRTIAYATVGIGQALDKHDSEQEGG